MPENIITADTIAAANTLSGGILPDSMLSVVLPNKSTYTITATKTHTLNITVKEYTMKKRIIILSLVAALVILTVAL